MTYESDRASILARPCKCVRCGTCNGSGYWYPKGFGDDADEPELCIDGCENGLSEVCDRCFELEELEHAYFPDAA